MLKSRLRGKSRYACASVMCAAVLPYIQSDLLLHGMKLRCDRSTPYLDVAGQFVGQWAYCTLIDWSKASCMKPFELGMSCEWFFDVHHTIAR
jgi:hypothetical protein